MLAQSTAMRTTSTEKGMQPAVILEGTSRRSGAQLRPLFHMPFVLERNICSW